MDLRKKFFAVAAGVGFISLIRVGEAAIHNWETNTSKLPARPIVDPMTPA